MRRLSALRDVAGAEAPAPGLPLPPASGISLPDSVVSVVGVRRGLQLYLVVLVGGHRDEGSLWEHVGAEGCVFGAKSIVLISLHDV